MTFAWGNDLDSVGEPREGSALGTLLSAQAARAPDAPALTVGNATRSFRELETAANRRARWFADLGVGAGDAVIISLPNGHTFYESVLACWKLGAIPAPVSHRLTKGEFAAITKLCSPRLIVSDNHLPAYSGSVISSRKMPPSVVSDDPLEPIIAPSWKMATTGGSTGVPKLVVDAAPGSWGPEKIAIGRKTSMTVINPAPLYHAAPFGLIIPAILQGCHVIEMERFDAERWLDLVSRNRVEWAYMVPTMMARIARLTAEVRARYDILSLRTLLHLAAPCPDWVKRFWIDWIGADAIWEIYGGAERLGSTMIGGEEWLAHPGSVGRPSVGTEIEIRSADGNVVPTNEIGGIYMRRSKPGSKLITPDGDQPQVGDWATFGDLGRIDEDGFLYIVDRRTDMIVSGGVNLYPTEIEATLGTCSGVLDAVVIGLPDNDLGMIPHAVIQCGSENSPGVCEEAVFAHLRRNLAVTKHPRSLEFTTRQLRDDAGKVRRSAWRAEVLARLETTKSE